MGRERISWLRCEREILSVASDSCSSLIVVEHDAVQPPEGSSWDAFLLTIAEHLKSVLLSYYRLPVSSEQSGHLLWRLWSQSCFCLQNCLSLNVYCFLHHSCDRKLLQPLCVKIPGDQQYISTVHNKYFYSSVFVAVFVYENKLFMRTNWQQIIYRKKLRRNK